MTLRTAAVLGISLATATLVSGCYYPQPPAYAYYPPGCTPDGSPPANGAYPPPNAAPPPADAGPPPADAAPPPAATPCQLVPVYAYPSYPSYPYYPGYYAYPGYPYGYPG